MWEMLFKGLTIMPGQFKMSHLLREHADVVFTSWCPVTNTFSADVTMEVLLPQDGHLVSSVQQQPCKRTCVTSQLD